MFPPITFPPSTVIWAASVRHFSREATSSINWRRNSLKQKKFLLPSLDDFGVENTLGLFFSFFLTAALPLFRIFYFIIDFPNSHSYQNVKQYGEERGALESWMFGSLMMDYGSKYVVVATSYVHFWFKEERLWINLLAWADG